MKVLSVNVGRALVKPQINEKSSGGIFLAQSYEQSLVVGEVILVGPRRIVDGAETAIALRPGFRILFDRTGSTKVKAENNTDEYLIIRQEDVIALVDGSL
jgi:co-chaperonin GroES (HSP10)